MAVRFLDDGRIRARYPLPELIGEDEFSVRAVVVGADRGHDQGVSGVSDHAHVFESYRGRGLALLKEALFRPAVDRNEIRIDVVLVTFVGMMVNLDGKSAGGRIVLEDHGLRSRSHTRGDRTQQEDDRQNQPAYRCVCLHTQTV